MTTRRTVLKTALGGIAGCALPLPRALLAADAPSVTRLTDKLALISGAGDNVLALSTSDGLVVVDSGGADASAALLSTLGGLPNGSRVHTLFNTHWHRAQVGSNAALGKAGARIVAHEKTRQRLAYGYYLPTEDRYEKPLPKEAIPTESFYTAGEATVGGEKIEYGYLLEAHTDGDIYVHFRNANVVAVGDAVSPARDPELDWFGGGWLGGRCDSLKVLLSLGNGATKFVPAYGPALGRADVQKEYDMMLKLFERFVDLVRKGDSSKDIVDAGVMAETGREWKDPQKFAYDAHKSMWAHHNTLMPDIV
ncbi:MAG TPA: MBL fold metallo-hydrolase [Gammaproteobacteria bacterium]|nr:MBL fold metallo-hydrolase [Gammaproteobacteria bacterium]